MKQLFQNLRTGELIVQEIPAASMRRGGVVVQNCFSVISAGTERTTVKTGQQSLLGKARSRPDLVQAVLRNLKKEGVSDTVERVRNRLEQPVALGYSCAGTVLEVASDVPEFRPGDRVACAGAGYASHAEIVFVPRNLCARVPDGVSFEEACFTTLGSIALQGVRQAQVHISDTAAVLGVGLIGLLTVQLLKAGGCRVMAVDVDPARLERAREFGADAACLSRDLEESGARNVQQVTEGRGFDAVILTAATSSDQPVVLAGELARDRGRVVVVGAVGMKIPRKEYYEKELTLVLSRSYGPGRYDPVYEEKGIDYPIGYVRWTEQRNMQAFLSLVAQGKVAVKPLITHSFPLSDCKRAYDIVTGKVQEKYLGIVLEYDTQAEQGTPVRIVGKPLEGVAPENCMSVGMIGAGNFAGNVLLPALRKVERARLVGVCDNNGSAAHAAHRRFGFQYSTTDYRQILSDPAVNTVLIATRHDSHGPLVLEGLKAGKHVYVEKPLCLSLEQLQEISEFYRSSPGRHLMVGFNRRFSPYSVRARRLFAARTRPLLMHYRVNAGPIPREHWVHDPELGGGRILGEVCHFLDWMIFLAGKPPRRICASVLPGQTGDNLQVLADFQDGSTGTILYAANGDASLPKERIEVFGDQRVCVIHDFDFMEVYAGGRRRKDRGPGRDKGHRAEIEAYARAVCGAEPPIPFDELYATTLGTFKILESLRLGQPVAF